MTAPPPDAAAWRPAALTASGTCLVALTYGVVRYGYGLQLPQLSAEFDLSPRVAGAVAAGSFVGYCLAALASQRLVDGRGARTVLWLACGLAAGGGLLVGLSWSPVALAVGVLVAGSAAGAASPAMVVAVAATVRTAAADRAQAVVNAGTGLGVVVAGGAALAVPQAWRGVWLGAAVAVVLAAWSVDRNASWPQRRETRTALVPAGGPALRRPVAAALLAGVGSAAVWTFGRDLLGGTGGLPERTTAALWCVLGASAVLGALSGDAVRLLGLRLAWTATVTTTAAGTALLALGPGHVLVAGTAGALFGGAYTALSGVLIAWAGRLRPDAAGRTAATLFVALTAGQAVGAAAAGSLAGRAGPLVAFWCSAGLLLLAACVRPAPEPATRLS